MQILKVRDQAKMQTIYDLHIQGKSYAEIALSIGLTKNHIYRMLTTCEVNPVNNQWIRKVFSSREIKDAHHDWCLYQYGVPSDEVEFLRPYGAPDAFLRQKRNAAIRGVPWEFTLSEWWNVWDKSGKWESRGIKNGQFVMARYGDLGPYAVGNVEIITCNQNSKDCNKNKKLKRAPILETQSL